MKYQFERGSPNLLCSLILLYLILQQIKCYNTDLETECQPGFSGTSCENVSDPCLAYPCPPSASCIRKSMERYCNCSGNFKGDFCNITDVLITCGGNKSIKHLILDNPIIECYYSNGSTPNNHCYDPDDNIVFEIEDDPSGIFSLQINSSSYCLTADPVLVNESVACVTIAAKEEDDTVFRPRRMSMFEVCVTFNEPPKIVRKPSYSVYNAYGKSRNDVIFTLSVNDTFGKGKPIWKVLESNVKGVYAHFINITEIGSDLGFLINSIPFLAHGQGGVWTIQVDDGGYPPLTDVTNAGFRVVYWSLSCSAADAELPCYHYALPITSIKCSTNIEGYKRYTVVDSAGIDLRIDENGNVFLNKSLSSLRPGLYDVTISVNIQKATPTLVNFTINVEAFRIANFTTEFNSSVKARDIILNGTNIVLTCDVDVGHPEERVTVEWFLNTSRIRPTPSSRFVLGNESLFPCRRRYTMLIKPITDRDIGTYMCQVRGIYGQNASSLLHIQVLSPPQLAIYPVTRSVIYGHRIEITCTILRPKGLAVEFEWLVDYKVVSEMDENIKVLNLSNDQKNLVIRNVTERTSLVIRNVTERTSVQCEVKNIADTSARVQSIIDVITSSTLTCPSGTDDRGTLWDTTAEEAYDVKNCTSGFVGHAVRVCRLGGIWEYPNYTECVRIDLILVNEESKHLREGIQIKTEESLLGELARLTKNSTNLYESDIDISVDTLNNFVGLAEEVEDTVTDLSLESFLRCTSNLLDEANAPKWKAMLLKEKKGASRLMRYVSKYGKVSSRNTKQLRNIEQNNLIFQGGLTRPRDIKFPEILPDWLEEERSSKVIIKKATIEGIQGSDPVGFSSTYYRSISGLLHKYLLQNGVVKDIEDILDVNSAVLDVTFDSASRNLVPPIRLELKHFSKNYSKPICGFWDFSVGGTPNGAWSTRGCSLVSSTSTRTICECDHTTNFAVLMSPGETPVKHIKALSIISAVGFGVSSIFLLITIILYRMYWRYVKSDRAVYLMNLCVALIITYIIFFAGVNRTQNFELCTAVAVFLHYILLVVFFIMLGEGVEMAVSILYVLPTRSRKHWLIPLCWVLPLVIVGISVGVTKLKGYGNDTSCWLSLEDGVLYAFVGPALFIISINLVILILVLRAMFRSHVMQKKSSKEQAKYGIRSLCIILPVIGVTWVFGIFSINDDLVIFQYLFAIFNSFQGFFIFLFHCLLNRQMKDAIKHMRRRRMTLAEITKRKTPIIIKNRMKTDNTAFIQSQKVPNINKKENNSGDTDNQTKETLNQIQGNLNNEFDGWKENCPAEHISGLSIEDVKISNLIREKNSLHGKSLSHDLSSLSCNQVFGKFTQDDFEQKYDKTVSEDSGHENLGCQEYIYIY